MSEYLVGPHLTTADKRLELVVFNASETLIQSSMSSATTGGQSTKQYWATLNKELSSLKSCIIELIQQIRRPFQTNLSNGLSSRHCLSPENFLKTIGSKGLNTPESGAISGVTNKLLVSYNCCSADTVRNSFYLKISLSLLNFASEAAPKSANIRNHRFNFSNDFRVACGMQRIQVCFYFHPPSLGH